jgi:hypothetical protein
MRFFGWVNELACIDRQMLFFLGNPFLDLDEKQNKKNRTLLLSFLHPDTPLAPR